MKKKMKKKIMNKFQQNIKIIKIKIKDINKINIII
jgi:hypothetical protein